MTTPTAPLLRGVRQIAWTVRDVPAAVRFWRDQLGARLLFEPPGMAFFDLDGVRLLLEPGAASVLLYLGVPSVRDAIERMRGSVEIVAEPHVIFRHDDDALGPAGTDEWQGFIRDSEQNMVGLVSHEAPGA